MDPYSKFLPPMAAYTVLAFCGSTARALAESASVFEAVFEADTTRLQTVPPSVLLKIAPENPKSASPKVPAYRLLGFSGSIDRLATQPSTPRPLQFLP